MNIKKFLWGLQRFFGVLIERRPILAATSLGSMTVTAIASLTGAVFAEVLASGLGESMMPHARKGLSAIKRIADNTAYDTAVYSGVGGIVGGAFLYAVTSPRKRLLAILTNKIEAYRGKLVRRSVHEQAGHIVRAIVLQAMISLCVCKEEGKIPSADVREGVFKLGLDNLLDILKESFDTYLSDESSVALFVSRDGRYFLPAYRRNATRKHRMQTKIDSTHHTPYKQLAAGALTYIQNDIDSAVRAGTYEDGRIGQQPRQKAEMIVPVFRGSEETSILGYLHIESGSEGFSMEKHLRTAELVAEAASMLIMLKNGFRAL